ncbi:MAG TPA: glycoside hydrolase family 43 protein [Labilithrix sp.]|nr:glycoside hydrolase family 43 protein [Labilithrix sp.]
MGNGIRLLTVLALGAVATLPTSAARADSAEPSPFESDFADPFVLRDGDSYFAFATGASGRHIQVARSRDLAAWAMLPDALPNLPSWAAREGGLTWAPSVLRRERHYVLYYTTADTGSGFQCISRAIAPRAEGPYVDDSPRPFVCQTGGPTPLCGSIDPSPFVDAAGRPWLLFKSDENSPSCKTQSRIWSQPLSEDGLSVIGAASALLGTDRSWEGPLIEGPSMIRDGNAMLLFYSANWYESADYAVGYARCDGPVGPCKKMTLDGPLFKSHTTALGPGGQELFTDAVGRAWMAYHAWTPPKTSYGSGGARSLRLARVEVSQGTPTITP